MISSILLSAFLTVAFLVTGGYALLRWASLRAGVAGHHGDQIAELCHLLMSLAMIGMVYGYAGPVADVVQIVGFGAFALYFLLRWVDGLRAHPSAAHGCRGAGHHFVMSAAMVWMVAAMPLLMGPMTSGSSGGHAGHAGHGGSDMGATMSMPAAPAPTWALGVSWAVIVLLVVGAGFWARESLLAPVGAPAPEPVLVGGGTTDMSGPGRPHPVARALTPRTDAACHCLMSLAMALGFLPML
ncbi:DUF5134 domain-containing protein [Pseudonocardia spinosispora]|uniref:DUF5134 domain-containing protein n=1 Tax=Pseudonocardia spinosispora TaxID=103441 RepID=UPI000428E349|nr:DUF5134 domain-containing protein [Pseudonocardia spinosispora]